LQPAPPPSSSVPSSVTAVNQCPIERTALLAKKPNRETVVQAQDSVDHEDSEIGTGPDGGEIKDDDPLDAVGKDKQVQGLNKSHKNGTKSVRTFSSSHVSHSSPI